MISDVGETKTLQGGFGIGSAVTVKVCVWSIVLLLSTVLFI